MLLLRVAANQAGIGLQEARLSSEQRLAAEWLERRVIERTRRHAAVNEELRKEIIERKRVEEELRRSEAYLAEGQRLTHTGSWAWNIATREIYWSHEQFRIFGFDPEKGSPSHQTVFPRIHPEDQRWVSQTLEVAIREKRDFELEHRIVLPEGTMKHSHVVGHPVLNESGDLIEFIGTNMDVTERKRVEESLREHASLLNLTHDTIFVRDMNDVITYWNRGAEELYGWTREEAVGKVSHQLMQTIFPAPLEEINAELFRTGRWEGELIHGKRDGTQVTVASRWALQRDEQGNRIAILETNNDITERKRAEYLTRHVFESSPDSISIVGRDYRYQRVNPVFARFWGVPAEKIVGMHVADVVGREVFEQRAKSNLDRCFAGEEVSFAEWFATPHGRKYRAISCSPLRPDLQRVQAALVIARDLTEHVLASEALREVQMQLAHVNRVTTMGQLAASIAHEVNQPLAAAVTNAHAALRWLGAQPPDLEEGRQA